MAKQQFRYWNPRGESQLQVQLATQICAEYAAQGFDLTLRQLYYQFVARGHIANTMRSYKNLGTVIDNARMAGLLDWDYIVDRTRNAYRTDGADSSPEDKIQDAANDYGRALWASQPNHVEVWVEKEALAGVVQQAADTVQVVYFACRGYVSQSEMYSAGQRFASYGRRGKKNFVIHLGDHDPSGIDMTRDIEDRLTMFAGPYAPEIRRIALNWDQIEQYSPPPNPAKTTDSRYLAYQERFGEESWELDALDPATLSGLIVNEVLGLRDEDLWAEAFEQQERERGQLQRISAQFDDVIDLVGEE